MPPLVLIYFDFGARGPYLGQVRCAIMQSAPSVRIVDLMHDAPPFAPRAAGHLLASLCSSIPEGAVVLAVIDPGVGTQRRGIVLEADGRFYVGPENGLLDVVASRARFRRLSEIRWSPQRVSATFHGRDIFAPVAAALAEGGQCPAGWIAPLTAPRRVAVELPEIIYVDGYGNAMTGLEARSMRPGGSLRCAGWRFPFARTFADVPVGHPLCLLNSNGLLELALNQGSAGALPGVEIGAPVQIEPGAGEARVL